MSQIMKIKIASNYLEHNEVFLCKSMYSIIPKDGNLIFILNDIILTESFKMNFLAMP